MSRYTSDIDTLRQVISQSIPQCVSSAVTLVVVLWNLIDTSWILTLVMFFTVGLIIYVTKVLAGKSAGFFIGQQRALGTVNGYIEEMISGQKVVKIFNHEEVCKEDFDKLNEELRVNAYSAGKFQYAWPHQQQSWLCAVCGAGSRAAGCCAFRPAALC